MQALVGRLESYGYPVDSITVIADRDLVALDGLNVDVEDGFEYLSDDSDETLWQRIKNFFTGNNDRVYDADYDVYRDSLRNGSILVLVDDDMIPVDTDVYEIVNQSTNYADSKGAPLVDEVITAEAPAITDVAVDMPVMKDETVARANVDFDHNHDLDQESLRLQAERMDVSKQTVQEGEVRLHKRVVEDVKTIQVPVMHEEVYIERRAIDDAAATDVGFDEQTISIPLMQEEVEVTKRPVVTEEILVHKRDIEQQREVSATLRHEELEVDKDGNAIINDSEKVLQR